MDETIKQLITGFPSFAGLMICVVILKQQNDRLLEMIGRYCKPCDETETEIPTK